MIDSFRGAYRFLSNFADSRVHYEDDVDARWYPTVEHAYQAAKSLNKYDRMNMSKLAKPGEAKRFGNSIPLRSDWESIKLDVMEKLVRQKFFLHKDLADKLLATGDQELVEGNTWNDKYWGCVQESNPSGQLEWVGKNNLGKTLMKVREELKRGK